MNRLRFSIGSFLVVVSALALGLGTIVSQSELAAAIAFTVFVSMLGLAATVACAPRSERRAFCAGFAIFALTYWLVEFQSPDGSSAARWPAGWISVTSSAGSPPQGPALITRQVLQWIERNLTPNRRIGSRVMAAFNSNGRYYPATIVQEGSGQFQIQWVDGGALQWTPANLIVADSPTALVAGHAVMGGLFALLGGVLTLLFKVRSEAADERAISLPAESSRPS
jgi:hypothetical protein